MDSNYFRFSSGGDSGVSAMAVPGIGTKPIKKTVQLN